MYKYINWIIFAFVVVTMAKYKCDICGAETDNAFNTSVDGKELEE